MSALLLGFSYSSDEKNSTLPGARVDLHIAYEYYKKIGIKKFKVITDIEEEEDISRLSGFLEDPEIKASLFSFFEELKEQGNYVVYDPKTLMEEISKFGRELEEEKVLIYYTGHVENGNIVFPSSEIRVGLGLVLETSCTNKNSEVLCILDCCYPGDAGLPFKLTNKGAFELIGEEFSKRKTILATSSSEESHTLEKGSLFTRTLFKCLKLGNYELSTLRKKVKKESLKVNIGQEPCFYASHPNLLEIWDWAKI